MDRGLRYFGGAVAFGFAAIWITWSPAAALVCLLSAAGGYGAVFAVQSTRAKFTARASSPGSGSSGTFAPPRRAPEAEDLAQQADELNHDLGHLYEPTITTPSRDKPPDDEP